MTKHLTPGTKWRVEVDINHLDALRRVDRLTLDKMEREKICRAETYRKIMRTGIASLHIIARFASYFKVSPGELIVWFPVPESQPEQVDLGKGRDRSRKRFWHKPGRRHYKEWKPHEVESLLRMRKEGFSFRQCGMILKRTQTACRLKHQETQRENKTTRTAAQDEGEK